MSEETSKTFTEVAIMHAQELDRLRSVNAELLAALQELVACKDLKRRAAKLMAKYRNLQQKWADADFEEYDRLTSEYGRRQPLAWETARAAIARALG